MAGWVCTFPVFVGVATVAATISRSSNRFLTSGKIEPRLIALNESYYPQGNPFKARYPEAFIINALYQSQLVKQRISLLYEDGNL